MIQKTIRRFGLIVPLVAIAMMLIAATSPESVARTHKTARHGKLGKIAQNAHRHHGKHFARLSRHHVPQRPLTLQEKDDIVQKIRTLAKSTEGTDEIAVSTKDQLATSKPASSSDDSVIAAEAKSADIQSQIAEAAKEELAEDNVNVSLDKYFETRPDATSSASAAMADALDPVGAINREQDFMLSDETDPNRAAQRSDVMAEIINWIGTRYVFGGEDRAGID